MFEFALIVVGFICGYAFRGAIGHEVSKLGTEIKAEIAKLKL